MASLPYMQFYVADYLADTAHLSIEEHGAYMLLLMNYWQRGKPLDNRNGRLAHVLRVSNDRWNELETVLSEFFEIDGDSWIHHRVERELEHVRRQQNQRSAAGRASAKARKNAGSERAFNGRSTGDERMGRSTKPDTDTDTDTSSNPNARARTPPADFTPNPIRHRQAKIQPGVDVDAELIRFKNHTFERPKEDWDGEWVKWITNAHPRRVANGARAGPAERRTAMHQAIRELTDDP